VTPRIALLILASWIVTTPVLYAQDLVPAAYTPGPVGLNVLTLVANFNKGDITFDPSLPIEDGHATISVAAVGYIRSFSLFGRYAHAGIIVPIVHGHVQGVLFDEFQERTRTGVGDFGLRLATNLYGARAMTLKEFAAYRWTTIVGFGLVVGVPVGEYDDTKVINIGTHRWSFKPEIGVSRRRGHWTFEGDVGMVAFTDNTNFLNGGRREQALIATFQGHVIYTIRPNFWVAGDVNFWRGGRVTTNGTPALEEQQNSRVGATIAMPAGRQQLRVAISGGAHTRLGGDFVSLGVSYNYVWMRRK